MLKKHVLVASKIRKIPEQFSFVDHRLVRDGYIGRLSHPAAALYLFLVTVGDHEGLSYYGDASLCKRLHLSENDLIEARRNLIQTELIAYEAPLYQVLDLAVAPREKLRARESRSGQGLVAIRDILRDIAKEAS